MRDGSSAEIAVVGNEGIVGFALFMGGQMRYTQALIANKLGVRREGVTEAAGRLQASGLIEYSRGKITGLDRPGVEKRVCECNEVVKREIDRLFPSGKFLRDDAYRVVPHKCDEWSGYADH